MFEEDIKREAPCEMCPPGFAQKASHVVAVPHKGITIVQQICKKCIDRLTLHGGLEDCKVFAK